MQIEEDWAGFAYVSDGSGKIGGTKGAREQALVLGTGDSITATTDNPEGMRSVPLPSVSSPLLDVAEIGVGLKGEWEISMLLPDQHKWIPHFIAQAKSRLP